MPHSLPCSPRGNAWDPRRVAALKYWPDDIRKWQEAYNLPKKSAIALHVPTCEGMDISFFRSNQLQVSVTHYSDLSKYTAHLVVTPWSTVSLHRTRWQIQGGS